MAGRKISDIMSNWTSALSKFIRPTLGYILPLPAAPCSELLPDVEYPHITYRINTPVL